MKVGECVDADRCGSVGTDGLIGQDNALKLGNRYRVLSTDHQADRNFVWVVNENGREDDFLASRFVNTRQNKWKGAAR